MRIINKKFIKKDISLEQEELKDSYLNFSKLKFGDIIIANRNGEINEVETMDGHGIGPFIVLENTGDNLICAYGTSKIPPINASEHKYLKINNRTYNLVKDTYFYVMNIQKIEYESVIVYKDELNKKDKMSFIKKFNILSNRNYHVTIVPKLPSSIFEVGDIFKKENRRFIIIDIEENNLICFPISLTSLSNKNYNTVFIDNNNYLIDFDKIIKINNDESLEFLNTVGNAKFLQIMKLFKEFENYNLNKKIIHRGSLLKSEEDYLYIYGEVGEKWLVFAVDNIETRDSIMIKINGRAYYTNFEKLKELDKKNVNYNVVAFAHDNEMSEINSKRKRAKKEKQNKFVYKTGDIVESISLSEDKYLVIDYDNKGIYCINIEDIYDLNPKEYFFNFENIKKSENIYVKDLYDRIKILKKTRN